MKTTRAKTPVPRTATQSAAILEAQRQVPTGGPVCCIYAPDYTGSAEHVSEPIGAGGLSRRHLTYLSAPVAYWRNRSRGEHQRWPGLLFELGLNGFGKPGVGVAALAAAGFDHGQQSLNILTA